MKVVGKRQGSLKRIRLLMVEEAMLKTFADSFREGKTPAPKEILSNEERGPEYYLSWCKWVFGSYAVGNAMLCGGKTRFGRTVAELRGYARGLQNPNKYRKLLDPKFDEKDPASFDQSLLNISWENTKIYPKFRDVLLGKTGSFRFAPDVQVIDTLGRAEKAKQYQTDKFVADPRVKALIQQAGVVPDGASQVALDGTSGDVEAMRQLGLYSLQVESVLADAIEATLDKADYAEIRRQCEEDLVDAGIMACEVTKKNGGVLGVEYIDIEGLVVPASKYKDFRDADWKGYVQRRTLQQLRGYDLGGTKDEQEKKLSQIAKYYQSYWRMASTTMNFRESYQLQGATSYNAAAMQGVWVLQLYFIACEAEKFVKGFEGTGARLYDQVSLDSKLGPKDRKEYGKTMDKSVVQYVYKCKWVVGTDIVFDFGVDDTVVREGSDGNKTAMIPLVVYGYDSPSVTDRCIQYIDQIEIANKKKQAALALMPPSPNIAIDISSVNATANIGGQNYDMFDLLGMYSAKGILLYSSRNEWSEAGMASNKIPVTPMTSGAAEQWQLFLNDIAANVNNIREVTGVSSVTDGSASGNDLLIGVMKGLEDGASNSMKHLVTASETVFLQMVRIIGKKYHVGVMNGNIDIQSIPLQSNGLEILTLDKNMFKYDFDFTVKTLPSDEEIQMMVNLLVQNKQAGELDEGGFLAVFKMLRDRDIEKAQFFLPRYIAAKKAADAQMQQQAMVVQSQSQQQAAVAIEEAKRGTIMAKAEAEIRIQRDKQRMADETAKVAFERQKELLHLQASLNVAETAATTGLQNRV